MIPSSSKTFLSATRRCCCLQAPLRARATAAKTQLPLQYQSSNPSTLRQFSKSSRLTYPRKDSQDKDSINTEATEYSKSATDDEGARQEDAAFDPNITDPQEQKDKAGEGTGKGTVSDLILCTTLGICMFDTDITMCRLGHK